MPVIVGDELFRPRSSQYRAETELGESGGRWSWFDGDDPYKGGEGEGKAFGGGWEGPQYVVTHRLPDTTIPGITFVDDFDSALAQAKGAAGDKYVNVLGASMGKQCLEAGQLDEIFVCIAPILLGDGVPFFRGHNVKLERISQTEIPLGTNLWFKVS